MTGMYPNDWEPAEVVTQRYEGLPVEEMYDQLEGLLEENSMLEILFSLPARRKKERNTI